VTLKLDWVTIDSEDPKKLASFWCEVLDYEIKYDGDDDDEKEVGIGPREGPGIQISLFEVHDDRKVKNRLHFDLRPDDQDAEVERVLALGAKKIDIGQGDPTWVVLADPEGNEFCILRPRKPGEDN
jgi:predicted enzyme related to lactoylglutathione lyase